MKRLLPLVLTLSCVASPLRAGTPPTSAEVLLTECPSRASLRASLLDQARAAEAKDPLGAGEAAFYAGTSYERATLPDSAILCYQRAVASRAGTEERLALADALLGRGAAGDLEAARALLDSSLSQAGPDEVAIASAFAARRAWVQLLAGDPAGACERFATLAPSLDDEPLWRYRMARAWLAAGDRRKVLALAEPLAVLSRGQDEEILGFLERATALPGGQAAVGERISRAIAARDNRERRVIDALGGRRVRFLASDGFSLGGIAVPPRGGAGRRAAIVLCAPGDTLAAYDSLNVALARAGWAVMLLDTRGSGWSVGPTCPLPGSWAGREDEMQTRCAKDVCDALRALCLVAAVDTSRYVVFGVGPAAPIAVEAAALDRRAEALVLLSPRPAPVDRGTVRAAIRRLQRPIFFSTAPEDYLEFETTDALYQAGNRPRSRVADARGAGHGAQPFRDDASAAPRLIRWLDEQFPPRGRPAPRPAAPRRG
jgi:tetratricopeptide (TPR) repeat protein